VTEFSNPSGFDEDTVEQYLEFYRMLRRVSYIKAAMSFIQSSSDPRWAKEAWRNEDGTFKPIVEAVGNRGF